MNRKRASQSGSNSTAAKLINKINKINRNDIDNSISDVHEQAHMKVLDDDGSLILTVRQKQQLQRNEFLEGLTKEQLKIEAKRRGQKTSGTKSELVLTFF